MVRSIARRLRLFLFQNSWRKINSHNATTANTYFPKEQVVVGRETYGPLNIVWMAPKDTKVTIGNYCSIGPKVTFLVGGEHNYKRISTWPFQSLVYHQSTGGVNRDITVEDDVWIGYDTLILSGVTIGKGSVIGARSVVASNVPPYSIYVGNKVIKKRFSDTVIEKIKYIDYDGLNHLCGDKYEEYCQMEINEDNIDDILEHFNS